MADNDIIRGGLDIVTDKTKNKPLAEHKPPYGCAVNKLKAERETAQPTAARFNKPKAEQETAKPTAARFNKRLLYKSFTTSKKLNLERFSNHFHTLS